MKKIENQQSTKISPQQLFCVAILIRTFTLMSSPYPYSADSMVGAVLSCVLQLLLALPILLLHKHNQNIFSPSTAKNPPLKTLICGIMLAFAVFFVFSSANALSDFRNTTTSIRFPVGNRYLALAMILLVCMYASHTGLRAISRGSVLLFGLGLISLLLVIFGSISRIELLNFNPVQSPELVFKSTGRDILQSVDFVVMFVLLSFVTVNNKGVKSNTTKEDKNNENDKTAQNSPLKKAVYSYITAKLAVTLIISFIGITVLGRLMQISEYPFFSIGAYSQPLQIQRSDAVYIVLFTLLCVLFVSVQMYLSATLISKVFPKFKYSKWLVGASVAIATVCN